MSKQDVYEEFSSSSLVQQQVSSEKAIVIPTANSYEALQNQQSSSDNIIRSIQSAGVLSSMSASSRVMLHRGSVGVNGGVNGGGVGGGGSGPVSGPLRYADSRHSGDELMGIRNLRISSLSSTNDEAYHQNLSKGQFYPDSSASETSTDQGFSSNQTSNKSITGSSAFNLEFQPAVLKKQIHSKSPKGKRRGSKSSKTNLDKKQRNLANGSGTSKTGYRYSSKQDEWNVETSTASTTPSSYVTVRPGSSGFDNSSSSGRGTMVSGLTSSISITSSITSQLPQQQQQHQQQPTPPHLSHPSFLCSPMLVREKPLGYSAESMERDSNHTHDNGTSNENIRVDDSPDIEEEYSNKFESAEIYSEIASKTKSVGRFNKIAYPDMHGHLPPPYRETLFEKRFGTQR